MGTFQVIEVIRGVLTYSETREFNDIEISSRIGAFLELWNAHELYSDSFTMHYVALDGAAFLSFRHVS